jgi:hypothetical protein
MGKRDAYILTRDQRQQQKLISLNNMPQTREFRVKVQCLMAVEIQDMLCLAARERLPFASLAVLRTGIETLALGLWWWKCASEEDIQGTSNRVLPGSLEAIVAQLPEKERRYFASFLDFSIVDPVGNVQRTMLRDVLNPIAHGDALTAANRIGSAAHHPDGAVFWENRAFETFRAMVHFFEITVGIEVLGS